MVLIHTAQSHTALSVFQLGNKAPTLMSRLHLLAFSLKLGIQRGQVLPEILQRTVEKRLRNEQLLLHILLTQFVARFTRKDDQFANHVLT